MSKQPIKITVAAKAGQGSAVATIAEAIAAQLKVFGLTVQHDVDRDKVSGTLNGARLVGLGQNMTRVDIVEEQQPRVVEIASVRIFEKSYSGEGLADIERDISEMFEGNPAMEVVPVDEYNLHAGSFKVSVVWTPDHD